MKKYGNYLILTIYEGLYLLVYSYGLLAYQLWFLPEIVAALTFLINLLIVYCLLNTKGSSSVYSFSLLLMWISLLFLLMMFHCHYYYSLSDILLYFLPVPLLVFYLSTLEYRVMQRYGKYIFIQVMVSMLSYVLFMIYNRYALMKEYTFLFTIINAIILCCYIYRKYYYGNYKAKTIQKLVLVICASVFPYLVFTFIPQFIFPKHITPSAGSWTILFILILPVWFTITLTKQYSKSNDMWFPNPLSNIYVMFCFYLIIDVIMFFFFSIQLYELFMVNNIFLILIIAYDLLCNLYTQKHFAKLGLLLKDHDHERKNMMSQLLINDELEKLSEVIICILRTSIDFDGAAIIMINEHRSAVFTKKEGRLEGLSVREINQYNYRINEIRKFKFNDIECIGIPLFKEDNFIGIIVLGRTSDEFTNNELLRLQEYMVPIASALDVAIKTVRHQKKNTQINYTVSERLLYLNSMDLALEDKRKLTKHLHDDVLQNILGVKNIISVMEGSDDKKELLNSSLEEIITSLRNEMQDLYPSFLSVVSLSISFYNLIDRLNDLYNTSIDFHLNLQNDEDMTYNEKLCIYQIIKELFTNVYKHAEAKNIHIDLKVDNNQIRLYFSDDGQGIEWQKFLEKEKSNQHLGILTIQQEMLFLDGQLDIDTEAGKGFTVNIVYPRNLPNKRGKK